MEHFITPWLLITLALGLMASIAVWARRQSRFRVGAITFFVLSSPFSAWALATSLGWAVPVIPGFTGIAGDYQVLGVKMVVGKGIYALIDTGPAEPRYYQLPWDQKTADAIQDMLDNPEGAGVMMNIPPFEWSWDTHPPQFWELPQPKVIPDKPPSKSVPRFNPDRSA